MVDSTLIKPVRLVNLTPHTVHIVTDVAVVTVPADGTVARVAQHDVLLGHIDADGIVPVYQTCYGDIVGLPYPTDGVGYIVSSIVKSRCPDRRDLYVPVKFVRDDDGNIIGCRGLAN